MPADSQLCTYTERKLSPEHFLVLDLIACSFKVYKQPQQETAVITLLITCIQSCFISLKEEEEVKEEKAGLKNV